MTRACSAVAGLPCEGFTGTVGTHLRVEVQDLAEGCCGRDATDLDCQAANRLCGYLCVEDSVRCCMMFGWWSCRDVDMKRASSTNLTSADHRFVSKDCRKLLHGDGAGPLVHVYSRVVPCGAVCTSVPYTCLCTWVFVCEK